MTQKTLIISILALALALFAGGSWYVSKNTGVGPNAVPAMSEGLIRSHSPILGTADAPVTIVEFFDPACAACRAFYPIVKDIMAEHGDAVRVAIRYTPFHGEASEEAIRVLEAARMQGVFEPVIEALLRDQPQWASHGDMRPDLALPIAGTAGLDIEAAKKQMLDPDVNAVIEQDRADVKAVGVRQTPTFFVNGRPLDPFGEAELRALVADEVAKTGG